MKSNSALTIVTWTCERSRANCCWRSQQASPQYERWKANPIFVVFCAPETILILASTYFVAFQHSPVHLWRVPLSGLCDWSRWEWYSGPEHEEEEGEDHGPLAGHARVRRSRVHSSWTLTRQSRRPPNFHGLLPSRVRAGGLGHAPEFQQSAASAGQRCMGLYRSLR